MVYNTTLVTKYIDKLYVFYTIYLIMVVENYIYKQDIHIITDLGLEEHVLTTQLLREKIAEYLEKTYFIDSFHNFLYKKETVRKNKDCLSKDAKVELEAMYSFLDYFDKYGVNKLLEDFEGMNIYLHIDCNLIDI